MKYLFLACMIGVSLNGLHAQTAGPAAPEELVYLHTSRDLYSPSDELNFKAYIRHAAGAESKSSLLYIVLLDPAGKTAAARDFPVSNNQCTGSLPLPDSLPNGEYRLIGYTGTMEEGAPENVFTRKVMIRNAKLPGILISLKADASWYDRGEFADLRIQASLQDRKPLARTQFLYFATKNGIPYQNGIGVTDENGKAGVLVRIPYTEDEGVIVVNIETEYGKLKGSCSILLRGGGMPVSLDFFPEGGTLTDGLDTRVSFRAHDFEGDPVEFEGIIVDRNNLTVDSIRSSGLGFGSFRFRPDLKNPLIVRITRPKGILKDFPLPRIQAQGVQLALLDRTAGFASFQARTNIGAGMNLVALAEADGRIVSKLAVALHDSVTFRIPTEGIAGGMLSVRLLNEQGKPVARRSLFFTPAATRLATIESGKSKSRDLNDLSLAVVNVGGQQLDAALSVSVSDAVLCPDWNHEPDIRTWFLLGPDSKKLPRGYFSGLAAPDDEVLDNLMISLMDSTATKPAAPDFRTRVLACYRPGPFDEYVARSHADRFFNEYFLSDKTDFPLYIKTNLNHLQEMGLVPGKLTQDDRIRQQLEIGVPILNVIRSIKPFTMENNQIYFSKGKNSLEYPKGALFIIDGTEKGYNVDILNTFSPYDISTIRVTEKISDILKYSGDASGLVLITTKRGPDSEADESRPVRGFNPTIYWNPDVRATAASPVILSIPKPVMKSTWRVVILGVDGNGNYVESVLERN
jgi:hypothetical protein